MSVTRLSTRKCLSAYKHSHLPAVCYPPHPPLLNVNKVTAHHHLCHTHPLNRISGCSCAYDLMAAVNRAAPPTGSMGRDSMLYTCGQFTPRQLLFATLLYF